MSVADDIKRISDRLARLFERVDGVRSRDALDVWPGLAFGDVLERLVAVAADRTGAEAVGVRIDGPAGAPVVALLGPGIDISVLEGTLAVTGPGSFRGATVRWSHDASDHEAVHGYRSAIIAPVIEGSGATGALVAYATAEHAFGAAEERVLRALVDHAGSVLATARRFARLEKRYMRGPTTGVANVRVYELER